MGLGAKISSLAQNDKVVETVINVLVSVIAFFILFYAFPQEILTVSEIPFTTAIPGNSSICKVQDYTQTKTAKQIISSLNIFGAINFTNDITTYPATWNNQSDPEDRCREIIPISLGTTDIVPFGWGSEEEDENARKEYVNFFSKEQQELVANAGNTKILGKGLEVYGIIKEPAEADYQEQYDFCLDATTTAADGTVYSWNFYWGPFGYSLTIYGKNSVINEEGLAVGSAEFDPLPEAPAGPFTGNLGFLGVQGSKKSQFTLAQYKKAFKQVVVECITVENLDPIKVFGIALGYGSLVAGAAMALISGVKNAAKQAAALKKGGVKTLTTSMANNAAAKIDAE